MHIVSAEGIQSRALQYVNTLQSILADFHYRWTAGTHIGQWATMRLSSLQTMLLSNNVLSKQRTFQKMFTY